MSETIDFAAPPATACYVYGIVPSGTQLPEGLEGIGAGEVTLVTHGDIAALVSEFQETRPLGTRADLRTHERVLDAIAQQSPTLPMRFGAVLQDTRALEEELLAAHHEHFAGVLAELDGHVQFTLDGRYVEETVLAEMLAEEPEILRLREQIQQLQEDTAYYNRIRLGELVVRHSPRSGKRTERCSPTCACRMPPTCACRMPPTYPCTSPGTSWT